MSHGVGMRSLAVAFPEYVRTNEWWAGKAPEVVAAARAKSLAKLWEPPPPDSAGHHFAEAMKPWLNDPFRGAVERRVLAEFESAVDLEARAARHALSVLGMGPEDVECAVVSSLFPDVVGCGDAVYLARELGLRGAAWNLESACNSGLLGFQTACSLVRAGQYRNVLVVVSCTYSRNADEGDTLSWISGDGAVAFVVGEVGEGHGLLGCEVVHTADTIDALYVAIEPSPKNGYPLRLRASRTGGAVLRDTAEKYLRHCTSGALRRAGVTLDEIDFLVVTTPNRWYPEFASRVLGLDVARTINMHAAYANVGPVLMPANLYHAALEQRIEPDDLVLLYAVGSVSSAGAAVVRWSDVKLGPAPSRGTPEP